MVFVSLVFFVAYFHLTTQIKRDPSIAATGLSPLRGKGQSVVQIVCYLRTPSTKVFNCG
jgi:hypothetical protein